MRCCSCKLGPRQLLSLPPAPCCGLNCERLVSCRLLQVFWGVVFNYEDACTASASSSSGSSSQPANYEMVQVGPSRKLLSAP